MGYDDYSKPLPQLGEQTSIGLSTTIDNPPFTEGKLFYDKTKKALSYYNEDSEVTVNLGQELLIRVKNMTGVDIPNGSVVYPAGSDGTNILIGLANCDDKEKCRLIGVVTDTIENGTFGYVTKLGEVGQLDTSAFVSGDVVYLSATNGQYTKTKPVGSLYITRIGAIKTISATEGSMVVDISTTEHTVETVDTLGFGKYNTATISFTDASPDRTLLLTPTNTEYCFYQFGDKYCKTTDSIQIPDEEGTYLVYYNLGILQYIKNPTNSQVANIIENNPVVTIIYWNAVDKKSEYLGYELHRQGSMAGEIHSYLHFGFGFRYLGGLLPNTISEDGNGSLDAHAQFGMDGGRIADEDLDFSTPTILSTSGLRIAYINGTTATPTLRFTTNAGFSVLNEVGGRLKYNSHLANAYALTEVQDGYFVCCHIYAINENNLSKRLFAFVGSNEYATLAEAKLGANYEVVNIPLVGILPHEIKAIATFIFESQSAYSNAVKARIRLIETGVKFYDWRASQIGGGVGSGASIQTNIFSDDAFKIYNFTDVTKLLSFNLNALTANNTRIITVPDRNLILNDIRNTTTTNFTAGSIPFSDGSNIVIDNDNLFWNNTNKRLGIGIKLPLYTLDIVGDSRISTSMITPTIYGSITTAENLTIRSNSADLTTGSINFLDTKEATSATVGAVVIAGGLAVAKKIWSTDLTVTNAISGNISGNAGTVTNATLTTALTVNTGTLTLTANVANTSVLTIGAGAVSISGSNNGDVTLATNHGLALTNQVLAMGTPSTLTASTTNTVTTTTHTHAIMGFLTNLNGAVLTDQTTPQTIGLTGSRLSKLWSTDLEVTNAIIGSITGNAETATKLFATKTINGVAFDGSANITVTAAADTLSGTTLNSTVTASSLTSVGTLGSLTVTGRITQAGTFASIYVSGGTTQQAIATGATPTKSTAFTTNGLSANCSPDATNDHITITQAGKYKVSGSFSFSTGTNNSISTFAVFLNGVGQPQLMGRVIATSSAAAYSTSFMDTITASANQDIDVRIRHDRPGSVNYTIVYGQLYVEYVGE